MAPTVVESMKTASVAAAREVDERRVAAVDMVKVVVVSDGGAVALLVRVCFCALKHEKLVKAKCCR